MYRKMDFARMTCALALLSISTSSAIAQLPSVQKRRPLSNPALTTPAPAPSQFKAIFEPVNYNQDLKLFDAFFVTSEEGWVSGAAGTILHTTDGGKIWTAQLGGDPQAQGPNITRLVFLDKRHGWAQAYGSSSALFRTTDGENWQQVNDNVPGQNVVFTTPWRGFYAYGANIYETRDAGATWKQIFTCAAQVQVQGLTKQIRCGADALHFPSLRTGYGVGSSSELGGGVVVKSEDGGATWRVLFIPQESGDQRSNVVFFLDDNRGFAFRNTGMYGTADGGNTWQGVAASLPRNDAPLKFADPEVGWVLAQLPASGTSRVTYTVDGGAHWLARDLHFPAIVNGFSLPRRDTAYVVGEHGMVYRYRIVPIDHQVANMIAAPVMSGYNSPLNQEVATLRTAVNDLAAQMQNKLGIPLPPAIVGQGTNQGALQQTSSNSGIDTTQASAQQSATTPPAADASQGGFQQSTQPSLADAGPATGHQSTQASGTDAGQGTFQQSTVTQAQDPNQGVFQQSATSPSGIDPTQGGGFQQPATDGGIVASCCGNALQNLQSTVGTLATDIPIFSGQFRNLNLITAGLQFVADLLQHASAVKQAFNNLRQAPDKQSAAAALTALSTQVNIIPSNLNGGFVQDVSSAFPQPTPAPTSFNAVVQPGTAAQPTDQNPAVSQQTPQQQQKKSKWKLPQIPNVQIPH